MWLQRSILQSMGIKIQREQLFIFSPTQVIKVKDSNFLITLTLLPIY